MSTINANFRFALPSDTTIVQIPAKPGVAISSGDAVFYDPVNNWVVPQDSVVAGINDTLANSGVSFAGIALAAVVAADTTGGFPAYPNIQSISIASDAIYLANIASTNLVSIGSTVAFTVGAIQTVQLDNTVGEVSGYVVSDYNGQTVNQIRVRTVGKFSPYKYAKYA